MSQENTPTIVYRETGSLRPHPLLARLPRIPESGESLDALLADIDLRGVRDPLKITAKGQLLDGRRRYECADQIGHSRVPCVVVEDGEVVATILASLCLRRHLTKSALAYTVYPLLAPAIEEARQRRMDCLKRGDSPVVDSIDYGGDTVATMARRLGIGRDLLFYAQKLHGAWETGTLLGQSGRTKVDAERDRPAAEEAIYCEGAGLGGVIAGFFGRGSTTGGPQTAPDRQLELFTGVFKTAATRWKYWGAFDERQRREALRAAEDMIEAMPEDLRAELAKKLTALPKGKDFS